MSTKRKDWEMIIADIQAKRTGRRKRIRMGSPGAAQVTRVRLLQTYLNIDAETHGPDLFIWAA